MSLLLAVAAAAATLVVGILSDPATLDPHRATDTVAAEITANVCEPLVRYRRGGRGPEPALATSWATADERTWTLTVRRGVRFHDGVPLDAAAVVANLERLRKLGRFDGHAERLGAMVFAIRLDRPNSALLATLAQPFFGIVSPRQLDDDGALVGTGPFRLASSRPGEVDLQPNAAHWSAPPRVSVRYRRLPSESALASALLAGAVDVTSALSPRRAAQLRTHPEITIDAQTGLNVAFVSLNNERGPLVRRGVRQALARAVDRHALVDEILGGQGVPARNPLPPLLWGYSLRTRELTLDRRVARRLLQEEELAATLELSLLTPEEPRPYLPQPIALAERLRDDFAAVGVKLRLERVPRWGDYVRRATAGDYEMALLGWEADTMDPNDFLVALLGSEAIGSTNRSRYRSAAMDALLKRGRRNGDPPRRASAYAEAQELFQREMPWIPLYHVAIFTAARLPVAGLTIDPTGIVRYEKSWKKP